ncbi:sensor histidine kinase [Algoriphagus sediminis]|uniref:histidine kinase n=1 Tax=Algoriphagus sediminis TaxID=3057113 RepID=A0ABT7YG51_9BACT|nr:ATP-binding protein [Algoriphagus sediminis]MDN3205503.1 ATP-binding protein [Algoriphagus sediminis]
MLGSSRGISLILSVVIALMVAAFLSLMDDATLTLILVASGLAFSASYLLITITLEFLVFREIGNIYSLLEKIQKKNLSEYQEKGSNASVSPLRKINKVINNYAIAQQKEIDTLQKNAEYRREFVADISHELKTPIFATQGYIHTLLDGAIDDKQVRMKFLKRAAKNLDSLDKLVKDLLTLNQIETGDIHFNFGEFNLKNLANEVIDQLEHKASKKGVELTFKYDEQANHLTYGDEDKIYRVIQNLLFNAINYNNKKKGAMVEVELKSGKSSIQVSVKDNGRGIPAEDLKRIFERFYRVEKSRSKEKGGTGLGLAIVKHVLEGHKSKISVSSTVGTGSIFSFSLPLVKEDKAPENEISREVNPN